MAIGSGNATIVGIPLQPILNSDRTQDLALQTGCRQRIAFKASKNNQPLRSQCHNSV
jgi:hypothetical protein